MKLEHCTPAFPIDGNHLEQGVNKDYTGMALLDYFAAKAMHQLIDAIDYSPYSAMPDAVTKEELAKQSYELAAAMLEARKKYID